MLSIKGRVLFIRMNVIMLSGVMLIVIMLSVLFMIMMNVNMLNGIMLSVVLLRVMAPLSKSDYEIK
jgi:hypothetical protein